MSTLTRRTMCRADALISDTRRDVMLAIQWGLSSDAPTLVVPGNGGVDLQEIEHLRSEKRPRPRYLRSDNTLIINPRGFRPGSVHQEIFFQAIPMVLKEFPDALFLCAGMQAQPEALNWVNKLDIASHVILLPYLSQPELWDLCMRSQVYVSISSHDGTPNTLLEAMACGCFPVLGDIESIREWITPGENGLLVDFRSPQATADAIIRGLKDNKLLKKAKALNMRILREKVDVRVVCERIGNYYQAIMQRK